MAGALMLVATFTGAEPAAWWGIVLSMLGCLASVRVIVSRVAIAERIRVEEIATIAAVQVMSDDVHMLRR